MKSRTIIKSVLPFFFLLSCIFCEGVFAQDSLNGVWNELEIPGNLPYTREWHSAIYDSQNERMIIFGGWSGVVYNSLNDVWSYNIAANTWTQISTTGGPPSNRAGHVAIYDSIRHRMVVFAGHNWWTTWYNDTWSLDLTTNTWTQLSTTGGPPVNRYMHAGVYDSIQDRFLIFGGTCGSTWNNWKSNETWTLNLAALTWEQLNTTNNPSPRECMSVIFDAPHNRMIVFGGRDNSTGFSDVQALNLSTLEWSYLVDFTNTVSCHSAVFNPQENWMIVTTGWGLYDHGQAAVFSTENDEWLNVSITSNIPCSRQSGRAIWDPIGEKTIMFGGSISLSVNYNDTWELLLEEILGIDITLSPHSPPIIVPEAGGSFDFNIAVANNTTVPQTFDIWTQIECPNTSTVETINYPNFTLPAGGNPDRDRTQNVPANAPGGEYIYYGYVGVYPWEVQHMDSFTFVKEGTTDGFIGDASDWTCSGEDFDSSFDESSVLCSRFSVLGCYPNPFNPATTIRFDIAQAGIVNLDIFDITGRSVGVQNFEPLHQWMSAGSHSITFDGSSLPSGIYFARLTSNGQHQTQKLVLMK